MTDRQITHDAGPPADEALLDRVYRRVVEVHYALAEADHVGQELHRWCLERLMDLLELLARRAEATPAK